MSDSATSTSSPAPTASRWKDDLTSGFLVFLIALPLCLGIALASGFPPSGGILTAIIGGLVSTWLGSARLTIKGPAAGLIVIALGAVQELGAGDPNAGYRRALATIVIAAVFQIAFALLRAGALGDFFPSSVVHGMLAAIGVIICSKQAHVLLGVTPHAKEPLQLLAEIPSSLRAMNPEVAIIGGASLSLLFGHLVLSRHVPALRRVPAPLVVLLFAVPLGLYFDLGHQHTYTFALDHHQYPLGPRFLVNLPASLLRAVTLPDFSHALTGTSVKYVVMFALVGSLESLLSAKAVDMLDPLKRRSDLDRDLLATGVGNLLAGLVGGLPMISEIVRSSANISYGARSRLSNFFHGLFLLLAVVFIPNLIHRIPLAALAAMLVFTGTRLASPAEFVHTFKIGREQLAIFVFTLVVTLATDLLVGVGAGIALKIVIHLVNGAPLTSLFKPVIERDERDGVVVLTVRHAAVFSNFLTLRRRLNDLADTKHAVLDFSDARLIDHTVMEKLHETQAAWEREGRKLELRGLDSCEPLSTHPLAARKRAVVASLA